MSTLTPVPTYAPVERVVMTATEFAALRDTAARLEAALLACEVEQAQLRAERDELAAKVIAASDIVYDLIDELAYATGRRRDEIEAEFLEQAQR